MREKFGRERSERVKRLQNTLPFCIGYEIKISERERASRLAFVVSALSEKESE